uniref:Protein lifeguard 1 n=1 Tax=Haemonchus contortus TaxID=6289 RepID=A0A7I4YC07_HAECO
SMAEEEKAEEKKVDKSQEDVEEGKRTPAGASNMRFDNASIRARFVRKVFTILTIMILVNCLMVAPVVVIESVRSLVSQYRWVILIAFLVFAVTSCTLMCCQSVARHFPCNFILLALFTLSAGVILMVICAELPPHTIVLALVTTCLTCTAIIIFASQTTCDITGCGFILFVACIAVMIFGICIGILSFFMDVHWLSIALSAVVCILFMIYLAYDIQMILGGRKHEISPEEYVFAALCLFIDIFEIFTSLLNLFNAAN